MRRDTQPPTGGIYRPRNPRASPLYQWIRRHGEELDAAGLISRPVKGQVLERFMACGDLHHGFGRIYRDQRDIPSFFKDVQFPLIGPAWLLSHLYRQLGIGHVFSGSSRPAGCPGGRFAPPICGLVACSYGPVVLFHRSTKRRENLVLICRTGVEQS